jgi:hypothetical protein
MSDHEPAAALPPGVEDQTDEKLPWGRVLALAGGALVIFVLGGISAAWVQTDEMGSINDDRVIATKKIGDDVPQIGIVEERMIELEDRAQKLTAARKAQLEEYGWVDREKKIIRIPVEKGMEMVVEGKR